MTDKTDSTAGNQGGNDGETPIHTQAKLEEILTDRLARQAREIEKRFSDYDELKAKAEKFDAHQNENRSETEKATARAEEAERKLAERDAADQKRADDEAAATAQKALVAEIAEAKGVDPSVLRGSTREDLEQHADDLLSVLPAPQRGSDSESSGSRGTDIAGGEPSAEDIVAQVTAR